MKVEIKKIDNKIHVSVSIPARKRDEKMSSWGTKEVLAWIRENNPNYNVDEMKITKQPEKRLHNSISKSRLSGEWVFENSSAVPEPKQKTTAYKKDSVKKKTPAVQSEPKKAAPTPKKTIKKPATTRAPQTTADILKNSNKKR